MSTELEADRPAATPWPWWRRHATTLLLVVCLAALATLGASSLVAWLRPGPLQFHCCGQEGHSADVGETFTWYPIVENTGESRMILLSARLIPYPSGPNDRAAALVGVRASTVGALNAATGSPDWPASDSGWSRAGLVPIRDYVLEPHDKAAITFVFRARQPGREAWQAAEVTYEVGGRTYTTRSEGTERAFQACVPSSSRCL